MNHNVDRRTLIQALAAFGPMTMAGHVWAAPKTDARLLVVFLRGAYDAANVVIPIGSDFYYQSRPALAVPRPGSHAGKPGSEAVVLDSDWGLHPALHDSILPLWQRKQIAFVPFAGTDDLTRSHFETQDTIELGQPINGSRNYQSGFMARLSGVLSRRNRSPLLINCLSFSMAGIHPYPTLGSAASESPRSMSGRLV